MRGVTMSVCQNLGDPTYIRHLLSGILVVVLFIVNAWLRHGSPQDLKIPMLLSLVAILLLVVSGWLGGKMVYEAGVGVDVGTPNVR